MNQYLKDKTYKIPPKIVQYIQKVLIANSTANGSKRAKFLVKNGAVTYQVLKRLKNFFDYFNPQSDDNIQYALAGGDLMKQFVNTTLNADRHAVESSKKIKQDIAANPNSELHAYQTPRLNETGIEHLIRTVDRKIIKQIINESDLKKNAVAIIVNDDNKVLLLKRGDNSKIWMPNKWALVGGGIERGESPEKAIKREILEETGLEIDNFINSFTIQRHKDSIEHVFICRYDGEHTDIKLDFENSNYGWYDINEIDYLETVPHLMEYIVLAFKKYE